MRVVFSEDRWRTWQPPNHTHVEFTYRTADSAIQRTAVLEAANDHEALVKFAEQFPTGRHLTYRWLR